MANDPERPDGKGEGFGRREFLKRAAIVVATPVAVAIGWPLVETIVGGIHRVSKPVFTLVRGFASVPVDRPVKLQLPLSTTDLYLRENVVEDVWVVRHSPSRASVFSPVCPHLGCRFDWVPARRQFVCPCHNSVFSEDGTVVSGPAPRPLDTLPFRIDQGVLWVEWERFQPGTPNRVRIG